MDRKYFVIVEKDKDSCYGTYCPDFRTVISAGDSFSEACANMAEAMRIYMSETGESPEPSSAEAVENYILDNYPPNGVKTIVELSVALPAAPAARVNISIPQDLLQRLDRKLAGHKNRRSRFIAQAVENALAGV